MSDKILDLLEKMYIELKQGQDEIKQDVQRLSNQMVQIKVVQGEKR